MLYSQDACNQRRRGWEGQKGETDGARPDRIPNLFREGCIAAGRILKNARLGYLFWVSLKTDVKDSPRKMMSISKFHSAKLQDNVERFTSRRNPFQPSGSLILRCRASKEQHRRWRVRAESRRGLWVHRASCNDCG